MTKILIIEDEIRLADVLYDWFHSKNFQVTVCHDGISGYETALKNSYDAIISDVMLPGIDGFSIVKNLRSMKVRTPVIMLTARVELQDKLQGFDAGAEDYLTKPFEIEELDARVKVLLRKNEKGKEEEEETGERPDFVLEKNSRILKNSVGNKKVKLSGKEYTLLSYFVENYNQILSKEQITVRIWGYDTDVEYNNEEVYISFLRKKLKFIETDTVIETVRGVGIVSEGKTMKQFKKKIMGLLLLIYMIAAIFILALLNFSYVQNNKNSISRILNMKFQIVSDQNGNKQEEVPKEQERISGARSEKVTVTEQKEDSYVKKSYLVAKAEDGTLYVKNMLPDTGFSEEEIIETAEKFLETKKTSGSYENYQFEISVHKGELLIAFADITSLKMEEQKYFIFSLLVAFVLGILWIYPAWKITGKIVAPLEEANRLRKEFVLFAGHELKTPVTVMKASLDMLEREGIHSKYLDYAAEENEKMRKLVIELLDYSKMEYQEEKSFRESVNFSQCIEGISLEFEAMAFEKAVILITDIQQNLVIDGNKEMLERMAETLLENAIRHTEAGKEVKIVLKKDEKKVRLSMENQGEAIPEEERRRLFEKFYHDSNPEEGHYGLGLAIAQSIAAKHHTEITVISENGWNCFIIDFPFFYRK